MSQDMMKLTRARAEKLLSVGADPTAFLKHANYHVRRKAWVKLGRQIPDDYKGQCELAEGIHDKRVITAPAPKEKEKST